MKFKKICKYTFIAMLAIFLSFIAVRIFMSSDRSALNDVYPTEAACLAYENKGEAAFTTCKLPHDMSEDGYFVAYGVSYTENTKEFQITVRYNESLSKNYLPGTDPESYYFELRDAEGNTVSKAEIIDSKERYFYRHFRLSFTDVNMTKNPELYLFLCCDEADYPAEHTEGILVAHPSLDYKKLRLSGSEKKDLSHN